MSSTAEPVASGGKRSGGVQGVVLDCPAAAAWELCSDWANLQRWWPGNLKCELREGENRKPGCLRYVMRMPGIGSYERLLECDDETLFMSYSLEENKFGLKGYVANVQFRSTDDGKTLVNWNYEVEAVENNELMPVGMWVFHNTYLKDLELDQDAVTFLASVSEVEVPPGPFSIEAQFRATDDGKMSVDCNYKVEAMESHIIEMMTGESSDVYNTYLKHLEKPAVLTEYWANSKMDLPFSICARFRPLDDGKILVDWNSEEERVKHLQSGIESGAVESYSFEELTTLGISNFYNTFLKDLEKAAQRLARGLDPKPDVAAGGTAQ